MKGTGERLSQQQVEPQRMEFTYSVCKTGLLQWCMSPKPMSERGLLEVNEKAQHLEAYAENLSLVDGKESTLQVFLQPPHIGQGMSTY